MTTAAHAPSSFGSRVAEAVQTLTPGSFALTMASGIISVGLELEGFHALSDGCARQGRAARGQGR